MPADSEDVPMTLPECGDNIDPTTFEQILEMDDDEEVREFSKGIVYGFFEQAESTFAKMDSNIKRGDLAQLSSLGHYLKGSSATLGLTKVKNSCEKIQNFGANMDESGTKEEPDDALCLRKIAEVLKQIKHDYHDAERALRRFYHDMS